MQKDIYDVQVMLATTEGTNELYSKNSTKSPVGEFHFCSQPLYGYYNMRDPWVVTRHIELLTMAGIDYLCFDATNAIIYPEAARNVLDTLLKYQRQGWKVPKAMFYTNSFSGTTATNQALGDGQSALHQVCATPPLGKFFRRQVCKNPQDITHLRSPSTWKSTPKAM